MTLTARQLAVEIRVAHEGRDHTRHADMLRRLEALAEGPTGEPCAMTLDAMTLEQLQERRNALHVALAAVNGRLGPKLAVRRASVHAAERACEPIPFHADTITPMDPTSYCKGPDIPFVPPRGFGPIGND